MKPAKVLAPCEDKETLRRQYEAALSEDFTDSLILQEPPTLIRRLIIRTIMERNHSANEPQLMWSILVEVCQLC
jgi:hypothetical protein